jgi:hypothetical protein
MMDGLFLACACLTGICGLPQAPARFETTVEPTAALVALADSPRSSPARVPMPAATLAERPVPRVEPPAAEASKAADPDKLSRAAITEVVQQKTGAIKRCYERALTEDASYGGTVQMGWKIQTDGRVTSATVIDADRRNATAEACLVAEILTWQFPAASEPTAVGVYPFVLDAHLLAHHAARAAGASRAP